MLCLSIILEYITVCVYFYVYVVLFLFSQGAVIEACTRAVYFVHLFNKTQTYNTFKAYMSIFSYNVSFTLPICIHRYSHVSLILILSLHYVGYSCLSSPPIHSTGGRGFDHYTH